MLYINKYTYKTCQTFRLYIILYNNNEVRVKIKNYLDLHVKKLYVSLQLKCTILHNHIASDSTSTVLLLRCTNIN